MMGSLSGGGNSMFDALLKKAGGGMGMPTQTGTGADE